jgi:uncharacterized protein (DUF427 family)
MSGNSAPGWQQHPDHRITIDAAQARIQVSVGEEIIADSREALALAESGHQAVFYLPRKDVRMDRLVPSSHHTHCPFKGDASYYSVADGAQNAAWSYERPYDEVSAIKEHIAFYPEHARIRPL